MKPIVRIIATTSLISLSACASIVSGSSQKVQVSTNPPTQSHCSVVNKLGNWSVITPGQIDLKRSKTDIVVNCTDQASGGTGSSAVESELEPWFLGNIIFGGIIGAPIDFATGAAWQYPNTVSVPLKAAYQPQPAAVYPAPSAAPAYAPAPTPAAPTYRPAPTATPAPAAGAPAAIPQYQYIPPSQLRR